MCHAAASARRAPLWLALVALAAACEPQGLSTERAARLAASHGSDFASFDRWARRAVAADAVFRNRGALRETLFAPVRDEPGVAGAWVGRDGGRVLSLGTRPPPSEIGWVSVRDSHLGAIQVATETLRDGQGDESCVILSRTAATEDAAGLTVTVAYRRETDNGDG